MKSTSFIADLDLLDVAEYIYYSSSFRTNILEEICSFKVEFPESSPKGFEFPKKGIKSGFRGTSPMPKTYGAILLLTISPEWIPVMSSKFSAQLTLGILFLLGPLCEILAT